MKRFLSITGIFALAILFTSAISILELPQDPPTKKKMKKKIKMVKVDENGKKIELDTVIEGDNVFVWQGDTIGGSKELKWLSKDEFDMDSLHQHFEMNMDIDYEMTGDGNGRVIIIKSDDGNKRIVKEFKMDGDSMHKFLIDIDEDGEHADHDIMMWNSKGGNKMIFHSDEMIGGPHPAHAPKMMFIGNKKKSNVIDLSDPGIISYNKKLNKDGTEKITIVRKQVPEEDKELNEKIIIHGNSGLMQIHEGHPGEVKRIKVVKSDDGNIEIIEDGNVWNVKKGSGDSKFITEDGKVIQIKEIKEGDETKVEVIVKEEVEEKEVEKK